MKTRFELGDEIRWLSQGESLLTFTLEEILPETENSPLFYVGPATTLSWHAVTLAWKIGAQVMVTESNPNTKLVRLKRAKPLPTRFQRKVLA